MNSQEMRQILSDIQCGEYNFEIVEKDEQCFLLARYAEKDIVTGKDDIQTTRKWYISQYATKSELVQSALKCVLTSMEHRARETFQYKGKRVYGPHFDVDSLWEICKDRGNLDYRPADKQDGVEDGDIK